MGSPDARHGLATERHARRSSSIAWRAACDVPFVLQSPDLQLEWFAAKNGALAQDVPVTMRELDRVQPATHFRAYKWLLRDSNAPGNQQGKSDSNDWHRIFPQRAYCPHEVSKPTAT